MDVRQAVYLQRFIHDTEPTAFIAITKSSEIIGKGFMELCLIDSNHIFTQKSEGFDAFGFLLYVLILFISLLLLRYLLPVLLRCGKPSDLRQWIPDWSLW